MDHGSVKRFVQQCTRRPGVQLPAYVLRTPPLLVRSVKGPFVGTWTRQITRFVHQGRDLEIEPVVEAGLRKKRLSNSRRLRTTRDETLLYCSIILFLFFCLRPELRQCPSLRID